MIFLKKPKQFNPRFEIVSCFVEHDGKFLLLHRHDNKSQGGKWGAPAGKINPGETPLQAMVREITEETGLKIPAININFFKTVYVRYPDYDFIYHMFSTKLSNKEIITINNKEHKDFKWVSPEDALKMPDLMLDLDAHIKLFYD